MCGPETTVLENQATYNLIFKIIKISLLHSYDMSHIQDAGASFINCNRDKLWKMLVKLF